MAKIRPVTRVRAQAGVVFGSADRIVSGENGLRGQSAAVAGSGSRASNATGAIIANQALVAGTGARFALVSGSGILAAQDSAVAGTGGGMNANAEADWQYRSSLPGVSWHHNFANANEVDNFRRAGTTDDIDDVLRDPGTITHITNDGITGGGCLQALRKAGTLDGSGWWRPFSALNGGDGSLGSGNGRQVNDPAVNGTVTVQTFTAVQGSQNNRNWQIGYYGNIDYQDRSPSAFDGEAYWLQFSLRLDPNFATQPTGGKQSYQTRMDLTLTSQELVTVHRSSAGGGLSEGRLSMYRTGDGSTIETDPPGASGNRTSQIRSSIFIDDEPDRFADVGITSSDVEDLWDWPANQWFTLMYYVVPGHNDPVSEYPEDPGSPNSDGTPDTIVRVYTNWDKVNQQISQGWIKIWDQDTIRMPFDRLAGYNVFIVSNFRNGANYTQDSWNRFDEFVFSKEWLPPPRTFSGGALETAASALSPGQSTVNPIPLNPNNDRFDISWTNTVAFWDDSHAEIAFLGKAQGGGAARYNRYSEATNTWDLRVLSTPGDTILGHAWNLTFDHTQDSGDYYFIEQGVTGGSANQTFHQERFRRFNRSADEWEFSKESGLPEFGGSNTRLWARNFNDAGMGFHPNLFGKGRPGLICWAGQRISVWDKYKDNFIEVIAATGDPYFSGRDNNVSLYVPGLDIVVYGTGDSASTVVTIFPANYGNTLDPTPTQRPTPDGIRIVGGNTGGGAQGRGYHMILDPRDKTESTIMLLERDARSQPVGGQVYTSNDGGVTWVNETAVNGIRHPFSNSSDPLDNENVDGRWTCCHIHRYGVVMGMSSYGLTSGSQFRSIMWRPG